MTSSGQRRLQRQAGFSMIEMLMTSFILAVGLLGLAMFQTMALRATRGNRSINTAVLVANQILDQAEEEGRLTWLNLTDTQLTKPSNTNIASLKYLAIGDGGKLIEQFNSQGGPVNAASPDPSVNTNFFTVTTMPVAGGAATTGVTSVFTVEVQFNDNQASNNTPIQRQVYVSRSITHG